MECTLIPFFGKTVIEHIKCNQRKFPMKLLRLALFALGKCSQRKFPIKKFNHFLHLNVAGVFFAKTHYSSLLMTTLWAAPFLIIISKEDKVFVRYLVKEAHVLQLPDNVGTHEWAAIAYIWRDSPSGREKISSIL